MKDSTRLKIYNLSERFFAIFFVIAFLVIFGSVIALANNMGYKDGYCSALDGSVIGDARVCNVDNQVVEIPSP